MPITVDILDKLKMAREMLGLSQQAVANILNVDQKAISHWENGINSPSPEHLGRIDVWLKEAEKQLNTPASPPTQTTSPTKELGHRATPALKQQVIERLRQGATHRQIKAELHIDLHAISRIRQQAQILVKSKTSKQAEHIEEAWNAVRNETRGLDPSKLADADKTTFAMALEDIRTWLTHYIQSNLADALNPEKISKEIKRALK